MKFVALVSGGKDSVFSIAKCLAHGHELVALANLFPPLDGPEELDSFMFQSAGAAAIEGLAECLGVPLVRAPMSGHSSHQGLHYAPTEGDEVEDLHALLARVQAQFPAIEAVASGAVLSTYQRTRVENVCERLQLQSLAFLWQYDQGQLLQDMVDYGLHAVLVKVCSTGLLPHKHLGKSLAELRPLFARLHAQHGFHVAGEGGEYESLTLDAPFFRRRIVLDETEVVIHSDDIYTPVGLLHIKRCHTEAKEAAEEEKGEEGLARLVSTPGGERLTQLLGPTAVADGRREEEPPPPPRPRFLPMPQTWRQGKQLNISGVCVPTPYSPKPTSNGTCPPSCPHARAAEQMQLCLDALQAALQAHVCTLHDVVYVHLYLRSMAAFGTVNAIYCQAPFHPNHPPSRSCIEACLPEHIEVLVDAFALAGSGASMDAGRFQARQVLHVKSLSGWAPLCIGPYSQANLVGHGHLALLAGQIGLEPTSMSLVTPPAREAAQAMYNCAAVLRALRASLRTAVMVVVYVNVGKDGEGGGGWTDASIREWNRLLGLDGGYTEKDKKEEEEEEGSHGSGNGVSDDDDYPEEEASCEPLFCIVGVSDLPRGAAIEFEVVAVSTPFLAAGGGEKLYPIRNIPMARRVKARPRNEEEGGAACPLPLPFQPPATYAEAEVADVDDYDDTDDDDCGPWSPLSYFCQSVGLKHVFGFMSVTVFLPSPPPASFCVDHHELALVVVDALTDEFEMRNLTWQQLSHVRTYYVPGVLGEEGPLREALAAALPVSCARTFVPVSCLHADMWGARRAEGSVLLQVQATALDLERLRTEAWVHEVPDGGI